MVRIETLSIDYPGNYCQERMPSLPLDDRFDCFAPTAPGLEAITARELKARGKKPRKDVGGVAFRANSRDLYESNLWLRTASRVLVRIGEFHASTFHELERKAKKLEWGRFLPREGRVAVRVTTRKSKLYHSDAVAERVLSAIARVAPPSLEVRPEKGTDDDPQQAAEDENGDGSQLFVVRLVHDECEVSADSSGTLLHRRGYRQEVAKAPLRETLAAAMVLGCGWLPTETLLDPLCGSGTIPIEAAMIANNIAPGLRRDFAFMHWPTFDSAVWNALRAEASDVAQTMSNDELRDRLGMIVGSDRDAGAIAAAERNAERAGVSGLISWREAALSESITELANRPPGWLLANPPYGVRVGDTSSLRNLYSTLGRMTSMRSTWRTGVLTAERTLAGQLGIPLRERFSTRNGGIPVTFFVTANVKSAGPE